MSQNTEDTLILETTKGNVVIANNVTSANK